jgi:hypothetical protein
MATATSTGSGSWSGAIWSGGSGSGGAPADGDDVVIAAGHSVLMDSDLSAWTGLFSVTIQGHATTPAMLYFKDGTNGYLKIRTGYDVVGTSATLKGRLLANSDGVWGNTGSLAFANKAIIYLTGNSRIRTQYLSVRLYCTMPTNKYVTTYNDKFTVSSINTGTNVITMTGSHGWSANRPVRIKSSGTLPAPLLADATYFVGSPSGTDLKLLSGSGGSEVDLTSSGSGTIEIYSGYETYSGVTTVNVFEDVTTDTPWITTTNHNHMVLVNEGVEAGDYQRGTITTINSGSMVISPALDSAQNPGARIWYTSRNVSIQSTNTGYDQVMPLYSGDTYVLQCEIRNVGTGTDRHGYLFGYPGYATGLDLNAVIVGWDAVFMQMPGPDTFSGVIVGCYYAFYNTNYWTISGYIAGCTQPVTNNTAMCNITGEIRGCPNSINGSFNTISGKLVGNGKVMGQGSHNIFTGDIASCVNIFCDGSSDNIISSNVHCYTEIVYGYQYCKKNILRNAKVIPEVTGIRAYYRNGMPLSVAMENKDRVDGIQRIYCSQGDIYKTACDGTGDAPSVDPDGGHGYCIEASNIQTATSGLAVLPILDDQRIWLTAAAHTVTYKLQTTYSSITAGNLKLTCTYIGTDGVLTDVTNAPAITTRSDDTDWSQTLAVTFTPSADGWATFKIELMQYEANDEVYVWPQPTIS